MATFETATIQKVNLKDDDINKVYSIEVVSRASSNSFVEVFPLDTNIKRIPLVGEQVIVLVSQSPEGASHKIANKRYYIGPTATQKNVHNNALPKATIGKSVNIGGDYSDTSAGNPNTSGGSSDVDLGDGFVERTDVGSLQPFLGDILIEGRFGHSLRFGYSPSSADSTQSPSWESSTVEDPITILSNGRGSSGAYNKFIIESVDNDLSSIWLTSSQKVGLTTSQTNIGMGVDSQKNFNKPSLILNSDRIILNSKSDYIILSGAKSVNIATPAWAMDMDKMFTILEGLIQQLADLTAGTATFATGVGPTGPATNVAQVQQLLTELKQMAQ
jgi:hypothetical protein